MEPEDFITQIRTLFSETDCQVIISALRQDPFVWESLQNPTTAAKILDRAGNDGRLWTPAAIFLIQLDNPEATDDLIHETLHLESSLYPLAPELRQKSAQAYGSVFKTNQAPINLEQAGLLALALRERRRMKGSWQGLGAEITTPNDDTAHRLYDTWHTAFACLFSMIPDPNDFFLSILPSQEEDLKTGQIVTVLHTLLSNPLSPVEQVNLLAELTGRYSPPAQLNWLQQLDTMGRSALATDLAQNILQRPENVFYFAELKLENADNADQTISEDPLLNDESLALIEMTRQLAAFYAYAGEHDRSIALLTEARDMTHRLEARISFQLAISSGAIQRDAEALHTWEQVYNLIPTSPTAQACLATAYLRAGQEKDAASVISENSRDPQVQLIQAKLIASRGDLSTAQEKARQGYQSLINPPNQPSLNPLFRQSAIHPQSVDIIDDLSGLNLFEESISVTGHALKNQPLDLPLIKMAVGVYHQAGQLAQAIQMANLSLILQPKQIELHRQLAELLEEAKAWEPALVEREQVMTMTNPPALSDSLALARVGLNLRRPDIILSICQAILAENPEEGNAHYLLGEAYLISGDISTAIEYFTQAILLIPEQPQHWLALSSAQALCGDFQKCLETLRAASLSIPQSSSILAALGEASLSTGSPSEALPSLRSAYALNSQSLPVALLLSNTLLHLGHYGEAREVVENVIHTKPDHPGLAYNYAQCLLASGEDRKALPYLFTTAQAKTGQVQPAVLLGQTVMNLLEQSQQSSSKLPDRSSVDETIDLNSVSRCLSQAMAVEPENPEIQLLLAEILKSNGQTQESYQIYRSLAESENSKNPVFYWRIQFGLGQTALSMDQVDIALAALQEAASAKPDNYEIQQVLAEAFYHAKLFRESLQTARIVLKDAPHHLDNLIWFTHLMLDLENISEAITALEKAVELAPERSDLVLLLGQIYHEAGNPIAAQQALDLLSSLDSATAQEFQKAGKVFSKMGDLDKTILFLEKARQKQNEPAYEILVELANAYDRNGNSKAALEAVEQAVFLRPDDISLNLLEAALYEKTDQQQAALACLEHILQVISSSPATLESQTRAEPIDGGQPTIGSTAEIHYRIARLLRSSGEMIPALRHAEEATQSEPGQIVYRSLAAHLAYALMELAKTSQFAYLPDLSEDGIGSNLVHIPADTLPLVRLLCTNGEIAFEKDDYRQASTAVAYAVQFIPNHPRVLALLARLEKQKGELQNTEQHFTQAFSSLNQNHILDKAINADQPLSQFDPDCVWDILGVAEAALELQQWQVSLTLFQRSIEIAPFDARPRLRFARALVICAESQMTYHALDIKTHAPGEDKLDRNHYDLFEEAYLTANRMIQTTEVIHWHNRGQAVFHPGPQTAKTLGYYIIGADDTAALIAAYSRSNQLSEAQIAAQDWITNAEVLLQLNLALRVSDPEASLAAIQSAIEIDRHNPVLQAAYAFTNANDGLSARQSIETAISYWPDEPEWHRFAANLCEDAGDNLAAIAHWQQAVDLDPGSYDYNFALGIDYLEERDFADAIKSLDQAIHINPFQADAWFTLAKANLFIGNKTEAMSCAEQACDLAPNQVDPQLLSGEIALRLGQHQKAISKAQAVLNLNPQNTAAILLNSRALNAMGQSQAALEMIDLNLSSITQPVVLLIERARLIKQIQGIQFALPVLIELAQKNPAEPEVFCLLAETQAEIGQTDAAERTAQASLKLLATQPNLHLLLGKLQRANGQLDQCISHLSETIRQDPAQVEAYLELGRAYQDRRENLQALKIYRQATQIAPNDPRPYYNAGLALRGSKDYLAAETMLRHAARLSPDDINIRRQLGAIITLNLVHHPQEASVIS